MTSKENNAKKLMALRLEQYFFPHSVAAQYFLCREESCRVLLKELVWQQPHAEL